MVELRKGRWMVRVPQPGTLAEEHTWMDVQPIRGDHNGHVWMANHWDPEAGTYCGLCEAYEWQAAGKAPCISAGDLTAVNTARSAYIARHRGNGPVFFPEVDVVRHPGRRVKA